MNLSQFIRSIVVLQWITATAVSCVSVENEKLPTAAKLTISIDQVSPALPPQIAYFIPDSALNNFLNRTMLDGVVHNRNATARPPAAPPQRPRRVPNDPFDDPMVDSMAAPQSNYRYVLVPNNQNRDFDESSYDDTETAYQNYAYNVNYKPLKEKKSSYWRYQGYEDENDGIATAKKKFVKKVKHPSAHKFLNYHPTSIRDQLNYLKKNHRYRFADDFDEDVDSDSERIVDGRSVGKKRQKKKKVYRKKQPVPTSSYESDDPLPPYYTVTSSPHHNHKDCDSHENSNHRNPTVAADDYDDDEEENYPVQSTAAPQKRKKSRNKGLTFYITKVRNQDANTERMLRVDKSADTDEDESGAEAAFIPTRYLASVRGMEKIVHKSNNRTPRKHEEPRIKERLAVSGGHVVYTEDGYEDKEYDHGSEEKYLHYNHRSRREAPQEISPEAQSEASTEASTGASTETSTETSTEVYHEVLLEELPEASELKGKELIDHLNGLIKNATDTLTSVDGELQRRYPFYNSTIAVVKESPLRYAEHEKPFRANDSNSYYKTKTKLCNEIADDVNVTTDESGPANPTKRLNDLGGKIDCVKEKLFGENPLDNPLFSEDNVPEPSAESVFRSDSNVYTDVMHNIVHNKNQRVFSSYGISETYDLSSDNTLAVKNRPDNSLNTNEQLTHDDINDSLEHIDDPVEEEQNYKKSQFNNPAQLSILDISKFIPRPHPNLPAAPLFESDFVPVTATIGIMEPTTHIVPPRPQPVPVQIPVMYPAGSKPIYRGHLQPPRRSAITNKIRLPPNVYFLRRGQTMAFIRIPPPNKPR